MGATTDSPAERSELGWVGAQGGSNCPQVIAVRKKASCYARAPACGPWPRSPRAELGQPRCPLPGIGTADRAEKQGAAIIDAGCFELVSKRAERDEWGAAGVAHTCLGGGRERQRGRSFRSLGFLVWQELKAICSWGSRHGHILFRCPARRLVGQAGKRLNFVYVPLLQPM